MATDYKRMQQRGQTEAALLAENQVPLPREIITASDTGAFWVGNDFGDALADLPKQGPAVVDDVTALVTLPNGAVLPTVDPETQQLPDVVRAASAANFADPSTPEGAALAALIGSGGGGGTSLTFDPATGIYSVPNGSSITYDASTGAYSSN